ncbi:MAG: ribosome-binding factor A [Gammaproteobacteria bacterium CG11_big_fil_rev_8_21_14_0_20_46_22]|nr:MAG: ribosome-binding factor A [Gammaproteobacteria bacterium CG12_big_fil_rev_8_21_14_0_65_46_12]PIR10702.1 MAG: ribosome-binding factor A [Gammaproteobacteria bacterium CG11_big_fil_rev_8_21_14_0_20_46_22]
MASPERVARVARALQQVLAELIAREVKDPRVQGVTITDVDVSRDLAHARVYLAFSHENIAETLKGFEKASGFLRKRVGEELDLRITPSLKFYHDPAVKAGGRMDDILSRL